MMQTLSSPQYAAMSALPYDKRPQFVKEAAQQNILSAPAAGFAANAYQQRHEAERIGQQQAAALLDKQRMEAHLAIPGVHTDTWTDQQRQDFLNGKDPRQIQHESNNEWLLSTPDGRRSLAAAAGRGDLDAQRLLGQVLQRSDTPQEIDQHRLAWAQERARQRAIDGGYAGAQYSVPSTQSASTGLQSQVANPQAQTEQLDHTPFAEVDPNDLATARANLAQRLAARQAETPDVLAQHAATEASYDKIWAAARQQAALRQGAEQAQLQQGLQSGALRYTPQQKRTLAGLDGKIAYLQSQTGIIPDDMLQREMADAMQRKGHIRPLPTPIDEIPPTLQQQVQQRIAPAYGHIFTLGKDGTIQVPRGTDPQLVRDHMAGVQPGAADPQDLAESIAGMHAQGFQDGQQMNIAQRNQQIREQQAQQKAIQAQQAHNLAIQKQQQVVSAQQEKMQAEREKRQQAAADKALDIRLKIRKELTRKDQVPNPELAARSCRRPSNPPTRNLTRPSTGTAWPPTRITSRPTSSITAISARSMAT